MSTTSAWPQSPASPSVVTGELAEQAEALQAVVRALVAHLLSAPRRDPDVEDCVHEVFRRALEGQDRVRPGEPLRPWVLGIARHVAIDTLRQRARRAARGGLSGDSGPDGSGRDAQIERIADSDPGPESRTAASERAQRIRRAMAALPESQRRALELFHLEGHGYRDIATRLGASVGTVCTWIHRGRRALADALDHEEDER